MPPYPSTYQIEEIFQDGEAGPQVLKGIVDNFDPKVQLTVVGHDHHMAGDTHDKGEHFEFFNEMLDFSKPSKLDVLRVIGGGESPWACVECVATGKSKAGQYCTLPFLSCTEHFLSQQYRILVFLVHLPPNRPWAAGKKFHHEFCFVVRFNLAGKITKLRGYYDSAHMNDHVNVHHEHKSKNQANVSN
ncbi:MAG: hypothetical protein Q9223_001946 [Gallowayella weberi]